MFFRTVLGEEEETHHQHGTHSQPRREQARHINFGRDLAHSTLSEIDNDRDCDCSLSSILMMHGSCCRLNNSQIILLVWSLFAVLPLPCYSFTSPTLLHSHTIAHDRSGLPLPFFPSNTLAWNKFLFALSAKRSGFSPEKATGGGAGGVGAKRDGGLLSAVSVASTQDYSSRLDPTTLTTTKSVDLPFASSSNDAYLTPSSTATNNIALASSSESVRTMMQDYIAPVLSAAMLITGNTIGAGKEVACSFD